MAKSAQASVQKKRRMNHLRRLQKARYLTAFRDSLYEQHRLLGKSRASKKIRTQRRWSRGTKIDRTIKQEAERVPQIDIFEDESP